MNRPLHPVTTGNVSMTTDIKFTELHDNLKRGLRDQLQRLAAELAADPERMLPSSGLMRLTAEIRTCIEAVEAVIVEDEGDGD